MVNHLWIEIFPYIVYKLYTTCFETMGVWTSACFILIFQNKYGNNLFCKRNILVSFRKQISKNGAKKYTCNYRIYYQDGFMLHVL